MTAELSFVHRFGLRSGSATSRAEPQTEAAAHAGYVNECRS